MLTRPVPLFPLSRPYSLVSFSGWLRPGKGFALLAHCWLDAAHICRSVLCVEPPYPFRGVLVGALLVQALGARHPADGSTSTAPLPTASSPALEPVATTFAAAPLEEDATPPARRSSRASEPVVVTGYRGRLRVNSHPVGATVFVNNQRVGQTPVVLSSLPVGSRAIRVELNGYATWSGAVRIVANHSATVSARLEPAR